MSYAIDDMHGTQLAAGIQLECQARTRAQHLANERQESVYILNGYGESADPEEIRPIGLSNKRLTGRGANGRFTRV